MATNRVATLILSSLGALSITAPSQLVAGFSFCLVSSVSRASIHRGHRSRLFGTAADMGGDNMKILGVCGGIGSGKSTACKLMVDKLGCIDRIGELQS